MTDEEFNGYCAEVMDYKPNIVGSGYEYKGGFIAVTSQKQSIYFNPNTDLNQMAEVFDKLWKTKPQVDFNKSIFHINTGMNGIAKAMREFIESTKEES